jgi:hypothetical protein
MNVDNKALSLATGISTIYVFSTEVKKEDRNENGCPEAHGYYEM